MVPTPFRQLCPQLREERRCSGKNQDSQRVPNVVSLQKRVQVTFRKTQAVVFFASLCKDSLRRQ